MIPPNAFAGGSAEYCYDQWDCKLPAGYDRKGIFQGRNWAHHTDKMRPGALIRCRDINGTFDFMVTVEHVAGNTVTVKPWPYVDGKFGTDAMIHLYEESQIKEPVEIPLAADGRPVVRVDHLRATGYRVLGIDYERTNFSSPDAAKQHMREYVVQNNLTWPEGWEDGEPAAVQEESEPEPRPAVKRGGKQKEEAAV